MLKITNTLKAFVRFGFQTGLLICVFVFICSRVFNNTHKNKQQLVEAASAR